MNTKKLENENNEQYIFRICQMKEQLGCTWSGIADIINKELGNNYDESCYRKKWQSFNTMMKANEATLFNNDEYLKEIQAQKDELYKVKKQVQDQRREYNKQLISDARAEHLTEKLIEAANNLQNVKPLKFVDNMFIGYDNNEAIMCFSDWHYGLVTDNIWNKYNVSICRERVKTLIDKTTRYMNMNNVKKLHVLIMGDLANGAIHTTSRVASEEDTCDQLMQVSELVAEAINELSKYTNETHVYSTFGNHLRTVQNKKDSIHSDNMEKIIPWWLKQRLKNNYNVTIHDSEYYEFMFLNVCGYNIVASHGDLDSVKSVGKTLNAVFNKMYGETIDYVICADKHHIESFDEIGIESILVGSLCGTDEYANNKRLYSNPSQTLMMFNKDNGKYCQYNIKLV